MLRAISLFVLFLFSAPSLEALWYAPAALSDPSSSADEPQIASDLAGNATVVWREFDGVNTSIRAYTVIEAKSTSAVTISSVTAGYTQASPHVVMDPVSKASVAVWEELTDDGYVVKAASLPFQGTWTAPENISLATPQPGLFPNIAVSPSLGYFVAAWQVYDGDSGKFLTQSATYTIAGGWTGAEYIFSSGDPHDAFMPQVKVDGSRNTVVVWFDATNQTIQAATLPYGESWSSQTPINISAVGDTNSPQIAINPSGYVVAVWERSNGSYFAIQASTLQLGGVDGWSTPVEISTETQNAFGASVAVDINGNAVAVWEQIQGSDIIVQAAYLPSGGTWAAPTTLSTGTFSCNPEVTFDASGKAYAVWESENDAGMVIQASMCPSGGSWSAATQISQSGSNDILPHIAVISLGGSAIVCWTDYTQRLIRAAAWIPPPAVTNVSPPSGSVVGGDSVTITGEGFVNVTSVYFGSTPASFVATSPFTISTTVPPNLSVTANTTVDITVTTLAGTSAITSNDEYLYLYSAPVPTVTSIELNYGPLLGGNPVKIMGTNFVGDITVKFGLMPATSHHVISDTLIWAIAPAGSGVVDVTVIASGGTSAITALDQYTYN